MDLHRVLCHHPMVKVLRRARPPAHHRAPHPLRQTEVRYLKAALPFIAVGLLLFGAMWLSLQQRAEKRLKEGMSAETAGRMEDAIQSYEWAIQAYTPASSSVREAVGRLERIAGDAERKGDHKTARKAYQSIVSGLSVIEHFTQPYSVNLQNASMELERIERAMMQPRMVNPDSAGTPSTQPVSPE